MSDLRIQLRRSLLPRICLAACCTLSMVVGPSAYSDSATMPATQYSDSAALSMQGTVLVTSFKFTGNTIFSSAELAKAISGYAGRTVTAEELESARQILTHYYVDRGYINSGAVLPDQTVDKGVITFRIVEGKMSEVAISFRDKDGKPTDLHILRDRYIRDRVKLATQPPLNIVKLKDRLEILREDPNVAAINAELKPGAIPGESRLDVQVRENNPFQLGFQYSNRRPPSVGSTALDILASDSDLTGHGDSLFLRYDVLHGPPDDMRLAGADDFGINYVVPISPWGTRLEVNFDRTDTTVIEAPFTDLNIRSHTDSTSLTIHQPLFRKPASDANGFDERFEVFLTGASRENRATLDGRPFSFAPGEENGLGRVTVVRFGQELGLRSQHDAFSARSTFSFGLPWLGATRNRDGLAGGDFVSWLGQTEYVHLLPRTGARVVLRGTVQLADRPLLPVEQISIGGMQTVRGYREDQLVRDQGVAGSAELHIPVIKGKGTAVDMLELVPFIDGGYASNRKSAEPGQGISSVGVGVLFNPNRHFAAQLFYGYALTNVDRSQHDLQDIGLHFSVTALAF